MNDEIKLLMVDDDAELLALLKVKLEKNGSVFRNDDHQWRKGRCAGKGNLCGFDYPGYRHARNVRRRRGGYIGRRRPDPGYPPVFSIFFDHQRRCRQGASSDRRQTNGFQVCEGPSAHRRHRFHVESILTQRDIHFSSLVTAQRGLITQAPFFFLPHRFGYYDKFSCFSRSRISPVDRLRSMV